MKFISTILFFVIFLPSSFAWTELSGNIRGIVTNQESGQVIRGATINLVPFNDRRSKVIERSFSQDAGEFLFNDIPPGLYDLECSAFGFKTTRLVGIQVRDDRTKLAYFKMERGSAAEVVEIFTYAALEAQQQASTQTSTAEETALGDAPATIYLVTAEDITNNGYMSLDEVLADIPEFEIQNRSNPKENNVISARGVYGNDKLLILKDGHRYNSMVSTQYALMENYGIRYAKRIEIILGPASAIYGADAYMGVVNIITEKGNDIRSANVTGSYGNYNTTSNSFQVGWGSDKISFAIQGGFFHTDGANINQIYDNDFHFYNRNYLTDGTVLIDPFDATSTATIEIEDFYMKREAYNISGQMHYKKFNATISMNRIKFSSSVGAKGEYSPYLKSSRIGASMYNINLSQDYAFKRSSKWSAQTDFTGSIVAMAPESNFSNSFSSYQKAYKAEADIGSRLQQKVGYKLHKNHSLTAGLTFQLSRSLPQTCDLTKTVEPWDALFSMNTVDEDIYYIGTDLTDENGNSLKIYQNFYKIRRLIGAAFVEYQGNINDKLLITAGIRYDYIHDINIYARQSPKPVSRYDDVSPRIGLVYKPAPNFNVKAFAGLGFLQPSPGRKYNHGGSFTAAADGNSITGGFWLIPNPNLRPEEVRSVELSTTYSKGDFRIGLNGYFNSILNNVIYQVDFRTPTGGPSFLGIPIFVSQTSVNSEEAKMAYGATLSASYRLIYGKEEQVKIKFRGNYSYANGKTVGQEYLPFMAMHTAKLGILFQYKKLSINNNLLFRSKTYSNSSTTADGSLFQSTNEPFLLWNLFARYHILNKNKLDLSLFIKVNNVLNSRYYHITDNSSIALGASPQDPLRLLAGFSFRFGRSK